MAINESEGRQLTALVILAPGFEEIEALAPVDLLRRAGIKVILAGLGGIRICGSHDISVNADCELQAGHDLADVIVLPGGPGAKLLAASTVVRDLILAHHRENRLVAAICASPALVLHPLGLLRQRWYTCFTDMEKGLADGEFHPVPCVQDGTIITARGVGAACDFGLAIVHSLLGGDQALALHRQTVQAGSGPFCLRRGIPGNDKPNN